MEANGRCHAGRARVDFGGGRGWAVGRGEGGHCRDSGIGRLDEGAGCRCWFDGSRKGNRQRLRESGRENTVG